MKVKGGIFVHATDIIEIKGVSLRSAEREIRLIKDALDKVSSITVFDCASYWDIKIDDLIGILNEIR